MPSSEYWISLIESEGFLFAEKIRVIRSTFPFFKESLEIIKLKLLIFNQSYSELIENEGTELKRQMERTLTKNKQFLGAVITIRFWLSEFKFQYSIQSTKLDHPSYELNNSGLYVSIFQNIHKSISYLSNLSVGSDLYWRIADNHIKGATFNQFLILNTENQIVEAIGSNIYLVKNGIIKGASVYQGAYIDITKSLLLNILAKLNLGYNENDGITEQDLLEADEIFLVNAINGIQWVVGFERKRYFNHTIRKINDLFVRSLVN